MNPYVYPILASENYDGDSFDLTLDLGFSMVMHRKCRLHGADTPELRDKRPLWKAAAVKAKLEAARWVHERRANGGAFFQSENYAGKYGRPLGDIVDADGNSLRYHLFNERLAVHYHGQAKAAIERQHAQNIEWLAAEGLLTPRD